jgi:hypothetical protein
VAIALAAGACVGDREPEVASRERAIIGGVPSGDVAVVALVSSSLNVICSGTLVSSRVVLTAGHCVSGVRPAMIYVGPSAPWRPGDVYQVERVVPHPDYRPTDFRYADVGVVVLRRRAEPAPLPWNDVPLDESWVGRHVRLVGFGYQQPASAEERRIGDKMQTSEPITKLVGEKEFEYYLGTCNGDSGGPAFYRFPDGVERVIGVTSYGRGGCTGDSGSHRVDRHDAWIRAQIAAYDPPSCERDHRCVAGCAGGDPDCPCAVDDGVCRADCEDPAADPDCPVGCGGGDVCTAGCPAPDPDCGDPCGGEGHCVPGCAPRDPDCPPPLGAGETCTSAHDCGADLACVAAPELDRLACAPACAPGDADACESGRECRRIGEDAWACVPGRLPFAGGDGGGCAVARHAGRRSAGFPWILAGSALVIALLGRRRYP